MLIQFRVKNHRSLRDEQILSLVAARNSDDPGLLHTEGIQEPLLPAVAIYGANASGKTNVLLALSFMRHAVIQSHRLWEPEGAIPQEPFALSDHRSMSSLYEVDAVVAEVRYRYGFSLSADRVEEEWLYAWPNEKKQIWFERTGHKFEFGRNFPGENETIRELTRSNSLFLSAGAQNNHAGLLPIFLWFRALNFELRRTRALPARHLGNSLYSRYFEELFSRQASLFGEDDRLQDERDEIVRLLQAADTGILDVRVERDPSERQRVPRMGLSFRHKAADPESGWLPLEVESAGTVALLELALRLVPTLRTGGVLCVDEVESSLHPMLACALLSMFCRPEHNPKKAQLVFTTHDTNLLGNTLGLSPLKRDQVWFTEKDEAGASHLYPLTDFHPRKEENLERGYLQGRYGAVPFLGDLIDADQKVGPE